MSYADGSMHDTGSVHFKTFFADFPESSRRFFISDTTNPQASLNIKFRIRKK